MPKIPSERVAKLGALSHHREERPLALVDQGGLSQEPSVDTIEEQLGLDSQIHQSCLLCRDSLDATEIFEELRPPLRQSFAETGPPVDDPPTQLLHRSFQSRQARLWEGAAGFMVLLTAIHVGIPAVVALPTIVMSIRKTIPPSSMRLRSIVDVGVSSPPLITSPGAIAFQA